MERNRHVLARRRMRGGVAAGLSLPRITDASQRRNFSHSVKFKPVLSDRGTDSHEIVTVREQMLRHPGCGDGLRRHE